MDGLQSLLVGGVHSHRSVMIHPTTRRTDSGLCSGWERAQCAKLVQVLAPWWSFEAACRDLDD